MRGIVRVFCSSPDAPSCATPVAGHDPDLVTSLLASLLQLARIVSGPDQPHDPAQQELGLDSTGLPTETYFERVAVDPRGLEEDLLAEALLRVLAVGDASVLPWVSVRNMDSRL